jgi:hypothetical protein
MRDHLRGPGIPGAAADGRRERRAGRSGWTLFGIVVATTLVVAGLVVLGLFVLFSVAMNNWGSNK